MSELKFHPLPPRTRADVTGLKLMLGGCVFALLQVRLNGFDLLPDFLGCLLTAAGLGRLTPDLPQLRRGRLFAMAGVFISLLSLYDPEPEPGITLWGTISAWTVTPAVTALNLLQVFCTVSGLLLLARRSQTTELLGLPGRFALWFKLLTGGAHVAATMLHTLLSNMLSPLLALTLIAALAELVYMCFLFRAYKALQGAVLWEPEKIA